MKFGVVVFPGSNCDHDTYHVISKVIGQPVDFIWHRQNSVGDYDAVILPGGFAYGDYLRTGAIARFSPVMGAVKEFGSRGGLVLGICNGFQILCEAGMGQVSEIFDADPPHHARGCIAQAWSVAEILRVYVEHVYAVKNVDRRENRVPLDRKSVV